MFILPPDPSEAETLTKSPEITVFAGPMFAQKSSRLIFEAAKRCTNVVGIKPNNDKRYDARDIVTHDGLSFEKATGTLVQVLDKAVSSVALEPGTRAVFIDEGQFFINLVSLVESITNQGADVYVSTLDLDSFGNPFTSQVAHLLTIAENTIKCSASCAVCSQKATRTFRKDGSHEKVKVGGEDVYEPRCLEHWSAGMVESAEKIRFGDLSLSGSFVGEFGTH